MDHKCVRMVSRARATRAFNLGKEHKALGVASSLSMGYVGFQEGLRKTSDWQLCKEGQEGHGPLGMTYPNLSESRTFLH